MDFDFDALDEIELDIDIPDKPKATPTMVKTLPVTSLASVVEEDVDLPEPVDLRHEVSLIAEPDKLFDFKETKLSPLQQMYIIAYVNKGTKASACEIAGVSLHTVNKWLKEDRGFQEALQNAVDAVGDLLEHEAIRRAMNGSDKLLWNLLKGHKPDKYADKKINDVNISGQVVHSFAELAQRASTAIESEKTKPEIKAEYTVKESE